MPYLEGEKKNIPNSPYGYGVGSLFFTITASALDNGTISPSGEVEVAYGDDQMFKITPDSDNYVPSVLVDDLPATEDLTQELDSYYYKFQDVTKNHTIDVTFEEVVAP